MALSTLLVADLDNDAPNTAMAETSARPTISAEAVCAVRRGLRMEFSRPNLPEIPNAPPTVGRSRWTSAGPRAGASIPMPMKMATAPTPTSWMAGLVRPATSTATPRTAITPPEHDPAA